MKPTRFMRIPFFVSGYRVTDENMTDIARWCEGHVIRSAYNAFVRVPVNRATNKRQTEAYAGTWVILSVQRGERSFKVYTEEWLHKQFFEIPPETFDDGGIPEDDEHHRTPIADISFLPAQRNVESSPSKDLRGYVKNNKIRSSRLTER